MQRSARVLSGAVTLGAALALALPAAATLIPLSLTVEVVSVDPGVTSVAAGDRFQIDLTIDDTAVDDGTTLGGHFPGLLTSFVMTADAANTGSWTPSGVFDLGAASNFVTIANGDAFTFQVHGTGFPDSGTGVPFFDVDLDFTYAGDITDSGSGQTFAEQFVGGFDTALAALGTGRIRFITLPPIQIIRANLEAVPEPGTSSLLVAPLLLLARAARPRR